MTTIIPQRFACRRRTKANWTALNEVLLVGEWGIETDQGNPQPCKLGDGVTPWNSLPYANPAAFIEDAIANGVTTKAPSQNAVYDALALKQDADSDLAAIAALSPSNDDIIQRKAGAWTNRTMAQLKADLGLSGVTAGVVNTGTFVNYNGTTQAAGQYDGGTTAPSHSTRLNYDGYFYATRFYGDGQGLTNIPAAALQQAGATVNQALIWNGSEWAPADQTGTGGGGGSGGGHVVQGRLTTESGVPISTTDRTAQTTLYFTPFGGNEISLWDGSAWTTIAFAETSLALGTVTSGRPYDVFGYVSAGALALEKLAWTSDTARATAVTLQDGRYCKSGDKTRLYLGTFYTTSTTTTEDSGGGSSTNVGGKRYLWNYYNRVPRHAAVIDTTAAWGYTTNTWRQARANAGNQVDFVVGIAEDVVSAHLACFASLFSNVARGACTSVGLDSTSTPSRFQIQQYNNTGTNIFLNLSVQYLDTPSAGRHYLAWLEKGSDGTCNFEGTWSGSGNGQSGLSAIIRC